jgi:hypothetical protein
MPENKSISKYNVLFLTAGFLLFFAIFLILDYYKPLQMDELSTYIHCHDKTFTELIEATEVGVDWMPILYFLIIWIIDQIIPLTQTLMRAPNLFFTYISFVILNGILLKAFGRNAALIGIVTIFSHSLLIPFVLSEARPYGLFLLLSCWVAYEFQRCITKKDKKFHIRLFIANFLCPASHYFGGLYCAFSLAAFLALASKEKGKLKSVILSTLLGWSVFFICCLDTLLKQLQETKASISSNFQSINDLFTIYGTQVYFPLGFLVFFIFINKSFFKEHNSCKFKLNITSKFILFNSIFWMTIPLILFLFGKASENNFNHLRYYTPNLLAYSTFLGFLYLKIMKTQVPHKLATTAFLCSCILILVINTKSLASAYKNESPKTTLSFLNQNDIPVVTFSMRVAFHVNHYHSNQVYFLVGDQKYALYMNKFSRHIRNIGIDYIDGRISLPEESTLKKEPRFIFIHGPMGSPLDLQEIEDFAHSNGYRASKHFNLQSAEATHAFFFEKFSD